ncbi:MAG: PorP/SprF family type IX secretion system membrane protein [Bacteroidota bacterium]
MKGFLLSALLLIISSGFSQQPQVYNQFFMNPYIYNPAYAGVEGHAAFFISYRDQWTNIDSAPQLSDLSFHVPLKGGIGLGAAAFNISQGLLNTSAAKVTGSYLLNIDRTHFLRFGMSLGAGINSVDLNELADGADDPAIAGFLDQSTFFLGDVGVTYHFGHFNIGMALPNLFSYSPITQTEISNPEFSPTDNMLIKANYRGHISDEFAFEPHIIYRYSDVVPDQYEAVLIAHLYHVVWVGASYRQNSNIIGLVGAKIKEKLGIGFSYELGNSSISSELGPTLEVTLGYHLGIKKEHAQHVSSFIKSHRLSAEERARKAELERLKKLAELQESRPEDLDTEDDNLGILGSNSTINNPDVESETPTAITYEWDHREEHAELTRTNQFGEQETGIRLEKKVTESNDKNVVISWVPTDDVENLKVSDKGHLERELPDGSKEVGIKYERVLADGGMEYIVKWDKAINERQATFISNTPALTKDQYEEIEKGDPELTQDFRTHEELATADDQLVVKRGSHLLELPTGNFVIAGAFNQFQNAQNYSDLLFQQGFHDALVGFSSARGYYYVVVFESGNIEQARARRDNFRKRPQLSKAWVLQVTN